MNKNKFLNLIENFASTAKKDKWQIFYDSIADSFYWTKNKIEKDSKLVKMSMEVSFYLNKDKGLDGLMIQPFKSNFLTQNPEVANVIFDLPITRGNSETKKMKYNKDSEGILFGFSESIKKDIYKDALEADYSIKDLEKALSFVTK